MKPAIGVGYSPQDLEQVFVSLMAHFTLGWRTFALAWHDPEFQLGMAITKPLDAVTPAAPISEDLDYKPGTHVNSIGKVYRKLRGITTFESVCTLQRMCLDAADIIEKLMVEAGREEELAGNGVALIEKSTKRRKQRA